MNMHNNFSEWFLAAGIEWPSEVLEKRWVGVETFSAGRDEIVSLVELFFAFYEGNETFIENFRVPFKQADSAFRMKDNNRELSVLAGAKLVSIMENGSVLLGDFASMALVSCGAQNLRASACVNDIAERAAKHLNARAIARSQPDPNAESEDDETTVLIKTLQRDLNVVAEESNMLWWVFGETSRDTGKRWSDYSVAQAALMAGKELADLSRIAPGPAAAAALLDRVVKFVKPKPPAHVVLKDAIAELPMDWRQNFTRPGCPPSLLNLCPVSHGIKLSVDLAEGDAWVQALPTSTKTKGGGKIAPQLLAYQIFLEHLIASLWSKVK
jgi:hypothetical protein